MDFIQLLHALRTIRKHCKETPHCSGCRLHSKDDVNTCGVSPNGNIPAHWEFDVESGANVPSIFKKKEEETT